MKEKVLILMKSLEVGGVEKSLLSLLETIDRNIYDVDILFINNKGPLMSELPTWINVIEDENLTMVDTMVNQPPISFCMKLMVSGRLLKAISYFLSYLLTKITGDWLHYYHKMFKCVKGIEKEYDIAIAYTSIINVLSYYVLNRTDAKKKIGWIHFDVSKIDIDTRITGKMHKDFDVINVVSNDALQAFLQYFPYLDSKSRIFYNLLNRKKIDRQKEENCIIDADEKVKIVTLGRLSKEKGQDIIPDVCKELNSRGLEFTWYIIGDGCLKNKLTEEIEKAQINNIVLLGTQLNPYKYLMNCDIYVQTSIHEGYCITLMEARYINLPIVTSNFAGASEQVDVGRNGYIVERTVDMFADKIETLILNSELRQAMALANSSEHSNANMMKFSNAVSSIEEEVMV